MESEERAIVSINAVSAILCIGFALGCGTAIMWYPSIKEYNHKSQKEIDGIHATLNDLDTGVMKSRALSRDNQYRIELIEDEIESMKADIDGLWSENLTEKPESAADFPECE